MKSTRYSKKVLGAAGILLVAIAGGFAGNNIASRKETRVLPVRYEQPTVPTVVPTAPLDPEFEVNDTPTAEPVRRASVGSGVREMRPPRRATAQYRLTVECGNVIRRQNGTGLGGSRAQRELVRDGVTMHYEFSYQREESDNPIVEQKETCTISTERTRAGAEPRLAITLGCEGEATYTSNPRPISNDSGSWRSPSELLSGHTHVMTAPKSPEHISEHVRCTVSVVSR